MGLFLVTGLWIAVTVAGLRVLRLALGRESARAAAGTDGRRKGVRRV
ncbi:MAG: hypothetical protein ACREKI_02795 [Gemmatimonadota bacterium]